MVIAMFNFWYFFWLILGTGAILGLYFLLRKRSLKTQKIVLFSLLAFGFVLHFLKIYIPPYSVDQARMFRDSWFSNICAANIALFPFMFFSKKDTMKDYMVYIGILSGLLAFVYPQEPLAKVDQLAEQLDIVRFYYHHWMLFAVPLLMMVLGVHKLSYKRIWVAPVGLLALMLFIILNQIFQSELGFVPLRSQQEFFDIGYKNSSYIWGPGTNDAIGNFFSLFTPKFFKTVPVGEFAGQEKYWPWFWMIVPVFVLVTPLAFGVCMIFDRKNFCQDLRKFKQKFVKKEKTNVA
ncbi:MAG: YwaF family protein [Oscillospiraceae bacterium]|nr:YwaF family protein [Oscillospiraceae bacterium]